MRRGDVFIHDQPGPGGWGDPLERDPARVLRDVLNELVGLDSARDDYGVVVVEEEERIDRPTVGHGGAPTAWTIDAAATARRRAELRAARGWTTPPVVSR
jgi:N-methylhydantoinase B